MINWINSIKMNDTMPGSFVEISMNPFSDIGKLLLYSVFIWNFIGSLRFHGEAFDTGGRFGGFISNGVGLVFLIIFPFYYLYNYIIYGTYLIKEFEDDSL